MTVHPTVAAILTQISSIIGNRNNHLIALSYLGVKLQMQTFRITLSSYAIHLVGHDNKRIVASNNVGLKKYTRV